ncbi:unnamed protein product [Paramecium octaurelia]|uniref:Uncharacterized protein n=1 Tax=Paramecium octaurelia TaxID=43137 RepID=A0A8S1XBR7_PAROT|nr:unnamed protein product [Paramecium octaurelia]
MHQITRRIMIIGTKIIHVQTHIKLTLIFIEINVLQTSISQIVKLECKIKYDCREESNKLQNEFKVIWQAG